MTLEERREMLKELNVAVTDTFGYLDLIQDPDPGEQVDKDECLRRAHKTAKNALKTVQELLKDDWEERGIPTG